MPVYFHAYKPKSVMLAGRARDRVAGYMNQWATKTEEAMATYPPQQPTRYRRTMTLARSWHVIPAHADGSDLVAAVASSSQIAPYNRFVEGAQQTAVMKARGWPVVFDVGKREWAKVQGKIASVLRGKG